MPLELAQRVNVDGTGNVVDFCLAAKKLRRFVYISTAYVAGKRKGTVYEHELVMGQDFKNHYESTKFQAEAWVAEKAVPRVPTTILRPAIVVGDSQTGETQKFDGPYFILRTIAEAERNGRPVPQFGHADAPFNVVPVDFVVDAIAIAATDEAMEGETLHLVDPEPLNACELVKLLSQEYAGREPKGRIPPKLVETSLRFAMVRERFGGAPRESIVYLNHPVTFDTRRATALLEPHGLRPPNFRDYVERDDPLLQRARGRRVLPPRRLRPRRGTNCSDEGRARRPRPAEPPHPSRSTRQPSGAMATTFRRRWSRRSISQPSLSARRTARCSSRRPAPRNGDLEFADDAEAVAHGLVHAGQHLLGPGTPPHLSPPGARGCGSRCGTACVSRTHSWVAGSAIR